MHVKGYAFEGPEQATAHRGAWQKVKSIEGAVLSKRSGYAHQMVELDAAKVDGLTSLEKLVLADRGPSPFGGEVHGNTVKIYTD